MRTIRTGWWLLLVGLALSGCEMLPTGGPTQPAEVEEAGEGTPAGAVERQVAFPAEEYAKLDKHGSAVVKGRLRYASSQYGMVAGKGETVSIAPATRYSAEAAEVALAGKRIEPADPRAREYTHYVKTDANGYFEATGIPAGVFYVAGSVRLPDGSRSPLILKQIEVGAGQTREVDLRR
ncbi:carboxypeptidase regulatory-like domain-containing protein [Chromohalobacter sp. HP20-39]|uniref:carboxypeptidase regulatory-like domain-containing protein n=1 Tax=Chromohalobacter sp. HP20-39 TaxID=3079306 RepID=UPI00294B3BF2|nr:carboxypeptidase regulatory-like domain-containing protein [Chromohalobacter sp. HP20-39]MDV6319690.1 carboxypeptidase regulatory-like domain-containing protein [Chromohalobacter sp. HP20-39]